MRTPAARIATGVLSRPPPYICQQCRAYRPHKSPRPDPNRPKTVPKRRLRDKPPKPGQQLRADKTYDDAFEISPADKAVRTTVGDLPLPPILNPEFHAQRNKWSQPKPRRSQLTGTLQKALRRNPYAQALSTNLRACNTSGTTLLPSYFLQDFKFVRHPEHGTRWWVPSTLIPAGTSTSATPRKLSGSRAYALASLKAMRELFGGKYARKETKRFQGVFPPIRMRATSKDAVFRQDMPELVLKLRRDNIVRKFQYLASLKDNVRSIDPKLTDPTGKGNHEEGAESKISDGSLIRPIGRGYIIPIQGWDDIAGVLHYGCVLWFPPNSESEGLSQPSDSIAPEPGFFATYDMPANQVTSKKGSKIVVHNMQLLLGEQHVKQLRESCDILSRGQLFVLARKRTAELQLELWSLQGLLWDSEG